MGVFVYALDAATGDIIWLNDGSGPVYMTQPHSADSFAALAPQGYLVAVGDRLIVPNGRANAAGLDRHTGKLLYCDLNTDNKRSTNHVAACDDQFNNSGKLFDISDGSPAGSLQDGAIMTAAGNYTGRQSPVQGTERKCPGHNVERHPSLASVHSRHAGQYVGRGRQAFRRDRAGEYLLLWSHTGCQSARA
jgi:hypothetical protein